MDDFSIDAVFVTECLATFTPKETVAFQVYLNRYLSDGRLTEEDALEAACRRVKGVKCHD
ncbi:hypothetical protein [Geomonas agri]|uniref:hypothetical protein n=1 Tax=Geomonas agri TaxID=2873702 RepID=UPI001CD56E07|nr:hypothetical protein [Geomonas agri]